METRATAEEAPAGFGLALQTERDPEGPSRNSTLRSLQGNSLRKSGLQLLSFLESSQEQCAALKQDLIAMKNARVSYHGPLMPTGAPMHAIVACGLSRLAPAKKRLPARCLCFNLRPSRL